jgi:glycerol-3-phosphate cytidylyltransferase-like family protein
VGIHSNAEIARAKGPPVMTEKERYEMLDHVKWADRKGIVNIMVEKETYEMPA